MPQILTMKPTMLCFFLLGFSRSAECWGSLLPLCSLPISVCLLHFVLIASNETHFVFGEAFSFCLLPVQTDKSKNFSLITRMTWMPVMRLQLTSASGQQGNVGRGSPRVFVSPSRLIWSCGRYSENTFHLFFLAMRGRKELIPTHTVSIAPLPLLLPAIKEPREFDNPSRRIFCIIYAEKSARLMAR